MRLADLGPYHIEISPVPDWSRKPLWSVVIPTYNCACYLKEALESVLVQDLGAEQMEIIVVDDQSKEDNPEAVVEQYGNGRVQFYRQPQNVGKSRNYATGINMAKGKYIHLLHGDDKVCEGFYKTISALFKAHPEASLAFCSCDYINSKNQKIGKTELLAKEPGILVNFIQRISVSQLIQPPSIVIKRQVYETIGTYDPRLKYIEDWEFYVRAALQFQFAYTPKPLAQYRIFPENSSSLSAKGGKRVKTIKQVLGIMDEYLPEGIKKAIKTNRRKATAIYVLNYIPKQITDRDFKGFILHSKAFFEYNRSVRLVGRWLRFIFQHKRFN